VFAVGRGTCDPFARSWEDCKGLVLPWIRRLHLAPKKSNIWDTCFRPEVLPDRIAAIQRYPRPTNLRALRRFIGMVGFYARFIPDYSRKAPVLHGLKRKVKQFVWCSEHQGCVLVLVLRSAGTWNPWFREEVCSCDWFVSQPVLGFSRSVTMWTNSFFFLLYTAIGWRLVTFG
jgi:hypothetical protein